MPWSFHNKIEIDMLHIYVDTIIPFNALQQLQKLEKIHLKECFSVEAVFEVASKGTNSGFNETHTVLKIPNLIHVDIEWVDGLKYIWKSNQCMVLEFPKLTTVSIHDCKNLEHIFTCSMVGSLVQLQDLHISRCRNIEVIVKKEEECDVKVDAIMLPHIKSLKLNDLPNLKGFYLGLDAFSWPSLDILEIKKCPRITGLTKGHLATSDLKVADTSFGMCDVREDLNSFIRAKQEEVRTCCSPL